MNHNEAIDRILELHQMSEGYDLQIRDGITAKSCTSCKTTMWPCDTATVALALKQVLLSPVERQVTDVVALADTTLSQHVSVHFVGVES